MAKATKAKPKAKKKKAGRPSKFGTVDMAQVEMLARLGWTDEAMSKFFKVHRDTWSEWKDRHPKFSDTLKDWKVEADARVVRSLYERAVGYDCVETKIASYEGRITDTRDIVRHYPPDPTAMIFWLKNRDRENWRDKRDHEHTGKDGEPIILWGAKPE